MRLPRFNVDPVVSGVGGFCTHHALPGVIGKLSQASCFFDPRIPDDAALAAVGVNLCTRFWCSQRQVMAVWAGVVNTIGFTVKADVAGLGLAPPVIQRIEIALMIKAFEARLVDIGCGEIGVKCLSNGKCCSAGVSSGQRNRQAGGCHHPASSDFGFTSPERLVMSRCL